MSTIRTTVICSPIKGVGIALAMSLAFAIPVFSQKVEDGWKGLLPFKSTKADVEKIFGSGSQQKDWLPTHVYEYGTDEALLTVVYAASPCDERTKSSDRLNVAAETVLRYDVVLKRATPMSEFSFDTNRFARNPDRYEKGEASPHFYYYQARENLNVVPNEWSINHGIWFEGVFTAREYVKWFHYRQPWGEREKHRCKDLKN